jgi:hypothetical protein
VFVHLSHILLLTLLLPPSSFLLSFLPFFILLTTHQSIASGRQGGGCFAPSRRPPDRASSVKVNKAEMTRQPSQAELILKDYVPIFQRGEMVEGAGGRHSIKAQIESLDVRLEENLDWNLGEHALLQDLVLEIRKVLIAAKMEKENLKQLKAQLEGATQDMKAKYEAAVVEMKKECSQDGERSWQDIVEICKQIEGGMPEEWKVRKCLQSVIEVVPLYVDALAIHDNRLWKYSSATSLDDVEVGEAVEDEKLGKGVVAGVVPMTGVVGITWSEEGLKGKAVSFSQEAL